MKLHACARVTAATGAFLVNSGFAAGANTGMGVVTLDFPASHQLDATRAVVVCNPLGALAAPANTTFGVTFTSDTRLTINIWQEGAAGAISAAANVDFQIIVIDAASTD